MTYRCCLCLDDHPREGRIREGEGVPLCAVHRAELRWKRKPAQQQIAPVDPILALIGRATLLAG